MNLQSVLKGLPCESSYWATPEAQASRDVLNGLIGGRKHQQAVPGDVFLAFDPALAATAALADHRRRMPKLAGKVRPRVVELGSKAVWG
jgi:hypothetical protein